MNTAIITIGDEILVGQTVDTNSAWIASHLNRIGIPVSEILSISDTVRHIHDALDRALSKADLVLVTGGLGPTRDDITKKALADYFGDNLCMHPETLARIEAWFTAINRPILEVNRMQALLPEKAEIIPNDLGTAAGMWFEKKNKHVISMPGVPYEMMGLLEKIIPRLHQKFKLADFYHRTIHFQGIGESQLSDEIRETEDLCRSRGVGVAYLPSTGTIKLRLTGTLKDATFMSETLSLLETRYPRLAYGYDEDTLESVIGRLLVKEGKTIGTAESCTGGALAARIVSVSGASQWYSGSVIVYLNQLKENLVGVDPEIIKTFGAVSQETVEQMALKGRALLGVDYCIATSGIAGPDGGSPEKPVGTTWIAVASVTGVHSKKFSFKHNRERNIESTIVYGLNFLRRLILNIQ